MNNGAVQRNEWKTGAIAWVSEQRECLRGVRIKRRGCPAKLHVICWYKLLLTADPAPSTEVELIECMVGTSKVQTVPIENPLPEAVTLSVAISDSDHFSVVPEAIQLGPYAQSSFQTNFRPSSLIDTSTATITLSHTKFGEIA